MLDEKGEKERTLRPLAGGGGREYKKRTLKTIRIGIGIGIGIGSVDLL